jgi:hypothetical protein
LAPHQAEPGILSGGVSSIQETSCSRFFAAIKHCVSRDIPAPENRSPPDLSRLNHRALGAWEVTAAIAIISLGPKTLRLNKRRVNTKSPSKFFVIGAKTGA